MPSFRGQPLTHVVSNEAVLIRRACYEGVFGGRAAFALVRVISGEPRLMTPPSFHPSPTW